MGQVCHLDLARHGGNGAPKLDARLSELNLLQDPWDVWYFSVSQSRFAAFLEVCDLMFSEDLEDAFLLSMVSGCTGEPFWSSVFTIDEHGQAVQQWLLVMGCDPITCLDLCDTAMSGFRIDSFVRRFATAHFGQRKAGSSQHPHAVRCIQASSRAGPRPNRQRSTPGVRRLTPTSPPSNPRR